MTPVLRYFKNSYRKKNKHRYSVWTGIPPSSTSSQCAFSQRKIVSQFEKRNEQYYHHAESRTNLRYLFGLHGAECLSARAGAVGCSRSSDTVIHSAGRYSEESSRICRRINNISVKSCEKKHSNSVENSVKATDIRTNADVESRKNIVQ